MNKAREIYKDTILDCLLCVNGDFSKCNQNNNTSLKSYLSFNLVWLTGAIDKETSGCVLALQKQLLRLAEFFFFDGRFSGTLCFNLLDDCKPSKKGKI